MVYTSSKQQSRMNHAIRLAKSATKKVKFIEETATCPKCNTENFEYEMRLVSVKTPFNIY